MKPMVQGAAWTWLMTAIVWSSCSGLRKSASAPKLRFIDEYRLPHNLIFNNTTVGGLSGIDYDEKNDLYYLVCDDASVLNPVRFYTASIKLTQEGIDTVVFNRVQFLRQPGGAVFPPASVNPYLATDPEAIRYHPGNQELVWSSEGERTFKDGSAILSDPLIRVSGKDGQYRDSFQLPPNMRMQTTAAGPRHNSVFEGLGFTPDYKKLFVSVEEPLLDDGDRAGLNDSTAWVRLVSFDMVTKKPLHQYAYRVEPVAAPPKPPGAFRLNGVTDILALDDHRFLVVERSYSTGVTINTIRIFIADLHGATDISSLSLADTTVRFQPVKKRPLATLQADNIEGVCFGPRLPNGNRTLLFVSDNNFSDRQVAQFLFYELTEDGFNLH